MEMCKCLECGSIFSIPSVVTEDNRVKMSMCPICDDGNIEKVFPCLECGKYYMEHQLTEGYCIDCKQEVIQRFSRVMDKFTAPERNLINTLYNGERI